jgi:hypothetical protein
LLIRTIGSLTCMERWDRLAVAMRVKE